jgi:tRNA/tmRNA/rRNA uracil-C5-methylase (TrmA/RlmC/RlmD family)
MEFAFHPDGILGLHPRGAWYDIIRLRECFLESPEAVTIVKAAQAFVESHGISCYHPRTQQGLLRELCVRQSRGTGEILLGIVTSPGDFPEGPRHGRPPGPGVPNVTGVVRSIRMHARRRGAARGDNGAASARIT